MLLLPPSVILQTSPFPVEGVPEWVQGVVLAGILGYLIGYSLLHGSKLAIALVGIFIILYFLHRSDEFYPNLAETFVPLAKQLADDIIEIMQAQGQLSMIAGLVGFISAIKHVGLQGPVTSGNKH